MPDQMTMDQFGQKIKAKYPAYAKLSDADVATKFLAKFPVYKSQVAPSTGIHYLPQQPHPTASVGPASGPMPDPKLPASAQVPVDQKIAGALDKAAPAVMATAGGLAGAAIAGPGGAMAGAALGGSAGAAAQGKPAASVYDEGLKQGTLELAGGTILPKVIGAAGRAAAAGVDASMAKLLGLKFAKNPRLGRATVDQIEKIANVVNQHVGGAATLPRLAAKIGAVKESFNQATEDLIQNTPAAKVIPYDHIVTNTAIAAQDFARATGREGFVKPIDDTWQLLLKKLPSNATPKEILEVRRSLLKETDLTGQPLWPAGTKKFRAMLYGDLNHAIKSALPPREAAQFGVNNSNVSKLIMAEDAVKERLAKQVTGQESQRSLKEVAIGASKAGGAAAFGAYEGYRETHSIAGAIGGGLVAYGAYRSLSSTAASSASIATRKAIAKAAPYLSKAAAYSPAAVRTLQAINAIRSQTP